jgi:hypothetical protein
VQMGSMRVSMGCVTAGDGVRVVGLDGFAERFAVLQSLFFYWNCHDLYLNML